jgi:hypothetical protein
LVRAVSMCCPRRSALCVRRNHSLGTAVNGSDRRLPEMKGGIPCQNRRTTSKNVSPATARSSSA